MEQRPYITCRQLIDFIALYVGDDLEEIERLDFERHLDRCPSCRAYLASYRETVKLSRAIVVDDRVIDDVPEELIRTILAHAVGDKDAE